MNIVSLVHFTLQRQFVNRTPTYTWLVQTKQITNIPLDETIHICIDNWYNGNENLPNIPEHDFRKLLNIATKESFFSFISKYKKQLDGVAMGSPLGPALANFFMCSFEGKWFRDCPNDFKLVFYRLYVDDIFTLFSFS